MNKLSQVRGVLRAIKSIALQGVYAETFKGMETQCVSTYRKCLATLKTIEGYEEVDSIAPELADNASMQEIGFAVETVLSLIFEGERPGPGGFSMFAPRFRAHGPRHGRHMQVCISRRGWHGPRRLPQAHGEIQDKMQEEMEEEQERFESDIEKIEEKIEELQERIEEAREQLEHRLEGIQEKYEEKVEEFENQEDDDDDEDDDKDEPKGE